MLGVLELPGYFRTVKSLSMTAANSKIPAAKRAPKMKIPGVKKKSGHWALGGNHVHPRKSLTCAT